MFQELDMSQRTKLILLTKFYIFLNNHKGLKEIIILNYSNELDIVVIYEDEDIKRKMNLNYSKRYTITEDLFFSGVIYGLSVVYSKFFKQEFEYLHDSDLKNLRDYLREHVNNAKNNAEKINFLTKEHVSIQKKINKDTEDRNLIIV